MFAVPVTGLVPEPTRQVAQAGEGWSAGAPVRHALRFDARRRRDGAVAAAPFRALGPGAEEAAPAGAVSTAVALPASAGAAPAAASPHAGGLCPRVAVLPQPAAGRRRQGHGFGAAPRHAEQQHRGAPPPRPRARDASGAVAQGRRRHQLIYIIYTM